MVTTVGFLRRLLIEEAGASEQGILGAIGDIFEQEVAKAGDGLYGTDVRGSQPHWVTLRFQNLATGYTEQTISVGLKDGDLQLADVYVPERLRGKGFLTNFLGRVRQVSGLTGRIHVSVAMDQKGWKTIVARSGFEWV